MMHGGIYDQLGGGFARYSVDAVWLVPHFEKMLYDNALLARAYLHGWQVIGERALDGGLPRDARLGAARDAAAPRAASTPRSTPTPRARRAASTSGTRTRCGRRWPRRASRPSSIERLLGYWGVSPAGNFEGRNILHVPARRVREAAARARRGAQRAPAAPARAAGPPRPRRQADLLLERADDLGARRRRRRHGARRLPRRRRRAAPASSSSRCATPTAACSAPGRTARPGSTPTSRTTPSWSRRCCALYEATLEVRWFDAARETADAMIERFADDERGGFFTTSHDHEELIARRKDIGDHPIPAGNSSAALGLLRLAALTGERPLRGAAAVGVLRLFAPAAVRHPDAFGHLLQALDFHLSRVREVALVAPRNGDGTARAARGLARVVHSELPAPRRHRRRPGGHRAAGAAAGAARGRGTAGRLRLRALRLQGAGDRAGGARRPAELTRIAFPACSRRPHGACSVPPRC